MKCGKIPIKITITVRGLYDEKYDKVKKEKIK
jgi:hypothetical protein